MTSIAKVPKMRTNGWNRLHKVSRRRLVRHQAIDLVAQKYNFLPQRFRWSGHVWRVRRVVKIWEVALPVLPPRRYFRVLCDDGGERMLFQDLRLGMWYMRV